MRQGEFDFPTFSILSLKRQVGSGKGLEVGGGGYLTLTIAMDLRTLSPPVSIECKGRAKWVKITGPHFSEKAEVYTICNMRIFTFPHLK